MSLPALDARLAAAAGYVRRGHTAADIGCDHGKLAAYLAASGACPRVIAADLRPGPLARADALCRELGLADKVECRLGDGLAVLRPDEAQDIVIAGVSGVTAAQILDAAPFVPAVGTRFIFVPPSKHGVLRRHLACGGYALRDETPVRAAGRLYTVLCAEYTGAPRTPAAQSYLRRVADLTEKYARGADDPDVYLTLAKQVREAAQRCGMC